MTKLESITLQNLLIMLFDISPNFCLLCSFYPFYISMHYADNLYYNCIFLHKNDHDRNKMLATRATAV